MNAIPFVSVIIPVYNGEKYINKCLESVRNQTFDNYEVIIVNDGSKDNSLNVVNDFIIKYNLNNFFVYSKQNGGLSSARNYGNRQAKGDWIAYVDCDDWIEPDYLMNLYNADCEYHADFYLIGFQAYDLLKDKYEKWSKYSLEYGVIPNHINDLSSFDYAWARFYKRSIIEESRLSFDERIRFCEDNAFNFDYIRNIRNYACISQIGYTYRRGHSEAMSRQLVLPEMRKAIVEHMNDFFNAFSKDIIMGLIENNKSFLRIVFNVTTTTVILDILEGKDTNAKITMRSEYSQAIMNNYKPKNKKDKIICFLWRMPYIFFKIVILLIYKNLHKIKSNEFLSHFATH